MLYGFVVTVDPWNVLPLSPPLPRAPISGNARFTFPALARSPRFDSVVLGTSSARLLEPAVLDPGFGARFANLAMNSATAYEQNRLFDVFLRAHPTPRVVMVGLDAAWCSETVLRTTPRPFPEWMYRPNLWPAYLHMLTPYAVQEAANQLAVMLGVKRPEYGLDGYTRFVPPEEAYDPVRRDQAFSRWPPIERGPAPSQEATLYPELPRLEAMLRSLPGTTRKIVFFTPAHIEQQGPPGSVAAWRWAGCKRRVAETAERTGAEALDFLIPSSITSTRDNYWDPVHYRVPIATRLAEALIRGGSADAVRLAPAARDGDNRLPRPTPPRMLP